MGYNTVAVIYNDHSDTIKKSGRLGERIWDAMVAAGSWRCQTHERNFGSGYIVSQAHADTWQITAIGCNFGYRLGDPNNPPPPDALEMAAWALREHGYKVTKPRVKKESGNA
ncbi:hypothetical protein [Roseixanthobacter glucoisosaccharinicivorans]|uniref:hypothetical protein n=1 Tax=Roseixanthobacter glucoisosaccharinicivorans TaxID=3119923 RepID=UPI00372BD217